MDCWLHPPRVPSSSPDGPYPLLWQDSRCCLWEQSWTSAPKYLSAESRSPQRKNWLVLGKTKSRRAWDVEPSLGGTWAVGNGGNETVRGVRLRKEKEASLEEVSHVHSGQV